MTEIEAAWAAIGAAREAKARWYRTNNCSHAHCPFACEHPQPMLGDNGTLLCGRCWFVEQRLTIMQPCIPGVCD